MGFRCGLSGSPFLISLVVILVFVSSLPHAPSTHAGTPTGNVVEVPTPGVDLLTDAIQVRPWDKLDGSLRELLISGGNASDTVGLVIFLNDQPLPRMSPGALGRLSVLPRVGDLSPDAVRSSSRQVEEDLYRLRSEILRLAWQEMERSRAPLVEQLEAMGATVSYRGRIVNALAVRAPLVTVEDIARSPAVARVYLDHALQGGLSISVPTIGAPVWWPLGYEGSPWDVAVVDTGIDFSHPYLREGPAAVFHSAGRFDPYYNDRPDQTEDLVGHGTHIAGIVASQNLTYRGVAFGVEGLINAKFAWRTITGSASGYWSDAMEAIDWAIAEAGADVISFSFGAQVNGDGGSGFSRYLDAVVDYLGVPVVVGVMNFGPGEGTVGIPSDAYNVISVGNMDDNRTLTRDDDVLHFFSGWGPTADGRIKPDVVAPGTSIASTSYSWTAGNLLLNMTGTSMATPHVAASVALLLDFLGEPAFPALAKALLVNSADDLGSPGADFSVGWGYINLTRALQQRSNYAVQSLGNGTSFRFYRLQVRDGDSVTLAWQRHVLLEGNDTEDVYSNLELEAYDAVSMDLLAVSNSTVDNVEQIRFSGPERGVILKVTAAQPPVVEERFALVASSDLEPLRPPELKVDLQAPCAALTGNLVEVQAIIRNPGDLTVGNVTITVEASEGMTPVEGDLLQALDSLGPGDERILSWTFAVGDPGSWGLSVSAQGSVVGEEVLSAVSTQIIVQESSEPLILWYGVSPPVVSMGDEATIEARICAGSGIEEALLSISLDGLPLISSRSMGFDEARGAYSLRETFWNPGEYSFRIDAQDMEGNWASVEDSFEVVDLTPPNLLQASVSPAVTERGAPVSIWAYVVDNTSLTVTVSIMTGTSAAVENLAMEKTGQYEWSVSVTPEKTGSYQGEVRAVDAFGNEAVSTFTFRIMTGTPPSARISTRQDVWVGQPVVLDGSRSMDDFGIAEYLWVVEGPSGRATLTGRVVTYVFNSTGTHRVLLTVKDHAGNIGFDEIQIRVERLSEISPALPAHLYAIPLAVTAVLLAWLRFRRRLSRAR